MAKKVKYTQTQWRVSAPGRGRVTLVKVSDPIRGVQYRKGYTAKREGNAKISYIFRSDGTLTIETRANYHNMSIKPASERRKVTSSVETTTDWYLANHEYPNVRVKYVDVYGPPGLDDGGGGSEDPVPPPPPIKPTPPGTPHVPGSDTKRKFFGKFTTKSSTFDVKVRYNTFLKHSIGGRTISRGTACLHLVRYDPKLWNGYEIVDTIFDVDYNVGNYWDPSTDKYITKKYNLPVGNYGFLLELEDTYQDTQKIWVRAEPTITQYTTTSAKEYDGKSHFKFYIVDPKTGKQIPYTDAPTFLQCHCDIIRQCYRVVVPKGQERVIRGDLFKGNIGTGGLLGDGGSARLREGVIKYDVIERIPPIVIPTDEGIGNVIGLPEVGWQAPTEEAQEGEAGERQNPFFWLDLITINGYPDKPIPEDVYNEMVDNVTCYPKGVIVSPELIPYNYNWEPKDWTPSEHAKKDMLFHDANFFVGGRYNDDVIELKVENPLDEPIKVGLNFKMDDNEDCGGGGFINFSDVGWEIWGKGDHVGDGVEELPTYVRVAITELVSNHEIIGGCPGCYAEVLIKSGDTVLKTIRVGEDGWTEFNTGNLYDYGLNEFDIEIKTYQEGYEDPRGYDVRCMFILDSFGMFTQYELGASPFNSMLDFYINDDKKLSLNKEGEGVHYFPVRKGRNKYKFVFTTNHWDYNWDYAEIPWIRLTNWICDDIPVVPYCEPWGGDKCIEALIGCVLGLLPKKKGCVIIKHINYDTGEIMKQVKYGGYTRGNYTFHALSIPDFEVVGDSSKAVFIDEVEECSEVEFYYRRLYRDCVYVIHKDIITGNVILKENYSSLVPGEYTFRARSFTGYKVVGASSETLTIEHLTAPPEECKVVTFNYEPTDYRNPYLGCVWVIHREKDNPNNVLTTDHYYNLEPGKYKYHAKDFEGYELVGDREKEITIIEAIDPVTECKIVVFEYRKIKKGCVIVKFKDRVNDIILDTDYYYELLPSEYSYEAKEFEGYKLVDDEIKTILVTEDDEECKEIIFLYEPLIEGCAIGKKIWLFT